MKKIIASIKLAPGNRGFFDPLTGINLSLSNSIGYIREDDDPSNIRKAIREGKIKIVGGQLPPAISIKPVEKVKKIKPVKAKKEEPKKVKKEKKEKKIKAPIVKKEEKVIIEEPKINALETIIAEEVKEDPVKAGE